MINKKQLQNGCLVRYLNKPIDPRKMTNKASRLVLGTAAFGQAYGIFNSSNITTNKEVHSILEYCAENGINTLDTAQSYGDSEKLLGENGIKNFLVVTKVFCEKSYEKGELEIKARASLKRLGIQKCHGILIHNGEALQGPHGGVIASDLRALVELGLTEKIGLSTYDPKEADQTLSKFQLDLVQIPMNLFDRRAVEGGFIEKWSLNGIEVHLRSIFLQGLLLKKPVTIPKNPASTPVEECTKYINICKSRRISPLDGCLSYAFKNAPGAKVVVGPTSTQEMQEIAEFNLIDIPSGKEIMPPWNSTFDPRNWN
jgi:aryl-alcohol dehydrogenase-like predicted oxidoreductase